MWILIIITTAVGGARSDVKSAAVASVEFTNYEKCKQAATEVNKSYAVQFVHCAKK